MPHKTPTAAGTRSIVPETVIVPPESPVPAVTAVTVPPNAEALTMTPEGVTARPEPRTRPPEGVETL